MPTNLSSDVQSCFSEDYKLLKENCHSNPHRFLGLHRQAKNKIIRLWRPGSKREQIELHGEKTLLKEELEGLFTIEVSGETEKEDYRVSHPNGLIAHDPYAFESTVTQLDSHLFQKGVHYHLYEVLGAHDLVLNGVQGVKFSVWAPNALRVSLIADYHNEDARYQPMRKLEGGIWEIFVPGLKVGQIYQYEILTQDRSIKVKSDPLAFQSELRPKTKSIVANVDQFKWSDADWITRQKNRSKSFAMNVYEIHLGSWKKGSAEFRNYRELAHELCKYCIDMGFTHIELLPIMEHPLDESWGYQVTGFFSATSRYGSVEDFQYFVNHMHNNKIGVVLDWVPGHFPTDNFALAQFDGTHLYEYSDRSKGFHPHWNTLIFDYEKPEVSNFLIASALFWLDKMHVDAIRVDAVASILYLDYGRKPGEWAVNKLGGNYNLEGVEFIQHLNTAVCDRFPHVLMIAEESTAYPGVTAPVSNKGLGFHLKWNLGWMNDTLHYFSKKSEFRHHHMQDLTFGYYYVFDEKFMCVLSHDEVVHEKKPLLEKMSGTDWQKFANMRVLLSISIAYPSKSLLFMGGEIAQRTEWNCKAEVDWKLLEIESHRQMQEYVCKINHFYLSRKELWEWDFDPRGFQWLDFRDEENCIIGYIRKGETKHLICIHHFKPDTIQSYSMKLQKIKTIREVFNSDEKDFGGTGCLNTEISFNQDGFTLDLAPLATHFIEVQYE